MKYRKNDFKTFVINGISLLGNVTTQSLSNKLGTTLLKNDSRVKGTVSDEVVVYTSTTLDNCIKNLHKTIRVIQMERYTKELEEILGVNKERLFINCRMRDKQVPDDALQLFFKDKSINFIRSNCVHKEENGIRVDLNALQYGIKIVTDLFVSMAFINEYKKINCVTIDLSNLGESKRIIDHIISNLKKHRSGNQNGGSR